MPLESLVATIGVLKGRIEQHQALLRQSEALTRYVLIDPLLRELGWDTEDPRKVRPEAGGLGGIADYELKQGDSTVALLEAKKLGQGVTPDGIGQALNYCNQRGIAYMIVSDGDKWEMYEVFRQARIEDRKLAPFSISADAAYQCALKALYLWQPNLGSGKRVESPPEQTMAPMPAPPAPAVPTPTPTPAPAAMPQLPQRHRRSSPPRRRPQALRAGHPLPICNLGQAKKLRRQYVSPMGKNGKSNIGCT